MTKDDAQFPSQVADKYVVRFPDGMRDRIAEVAKANGRSMNAEIISRLELSFNLEPLKDTKRGELVKLVNDAIDERMALEKEKIRLELAEHQQLGFIRKTQQK